MSTSLLQFPSARDLDTPVTLHERCRAQVLAYYDHGPGRDRVDLFSVLYSLKRCQPATVEHLRDDRLLNVEPAQQGYQKGVIRKKLATQFERALRNKMVVRLDGERRSIYQLTDRGCVFVQGGILARTALYKLNRAYTLADVCGVIANDELQVTMPDDQWPRRATDAANH